MTLYRRMSEAARAARAAGTAHWMAAVKACSICGTPYAATRDHAESLPTTPGSKVFASIRDS